MHKQFFFIRKFFWSSARPHVANRQPMIVLQSRSEKNNRYLSEVLRSFRFAFEPNSLNNLSKLQTQKEREGPDTKGYRSLVFQSAANHDCNLVPFSIKLLGWYFSIVPTLHTWRIILNRCKTSVLCLSPFVLHISIQQPLVRGKWPTWRTNSFLCIYFFYL